MEMIEEFCPAKVNLFLAVTGRREDGFHELVSLMAPLELGERLRLALKPGEGIELRCSDPRLPTDEDNLVWRAVEAFRARHPFSGKVCIEIEKSIPAGAGLGGGSSDAAGTLRGLNRMLGSPLDLDAMLVLAASIGSDCPFFLTKRAAVVRGRGECLDPLPDVSWNRLRGVSLLLMKPSFPVSTAWAYSALAARPEEYVSATAAEERLEAWLGDERRPVEDLLFNNLEAPVFRKYIPLAALKRLVQRETGLPVLMSGSGSTLFSVLNQTMAGRAVDGLARDAFGDSGWVVETRIG